MIPKEEGKKKVTMADRVEYGNNQGFVDRTKQYEMDQAVENEKKSKKKKIKIVVVVVAGLFISWILYRLFKSSSSSSSSSSSKSKCSSNRDCAGKVCSNGTCVSCSSTNLCPTGTSCQSGVCVGQPCSTSNACPGGYMCSSKGVCIEAGSCKEDLDCDMTTGQVCGSGLCVNKSCSSNVDCSKEFVCSQGTCAKACSSNADCSGNNKCGVTGQSTGRCVACTSNSDCKSGTQCSSAGLCVVADPLVYSNSIAKPKKITGSVIMECSAIPGDYITGIDIQSDASYGINKFGKRCKYDTNPSEPGGAQGMTGRKGNTLHQLNCEYGFASMSYALNNSSDAYLKYLTPYCVGGKAPNPDCCGGSHTTDPRWFNCPQEQVLKGIRVATGESNSNSNSIVDMAFACGPK